MTDSISLTWSSSYSIAPTSQATRNLPGDKILLPPSALEQLLSASTVTVTRTNAPSTNFDPFNPYSLAAARREQSQWQDTQQQLPHPLTFRLVNPKNGNVVYAGIREFSAEEGHIGLSPFLLEALGVEQKDQIDESVKHSTGASDSPIDLTKDETKDHDRILVHAKQLSKGTYVRLRPLEAGYNPDDWKSLLERHLRDNYTTLTNGEILTITGDRSTKIKEFRFLIDKFVPEGDGICVVDTDLEVDIEALNEEQARETMKQIMTKAQRVPGTAAGSSAGGLLDVWNATEGKVLAGEYVDYELPSWDRSQGLEIELQMDASEDLDLLVSPFSTRQRTRPRYDEYVWGDLSSEKATKLIKLAASNVDLEGADSLYISVHAYKSSEEVDDDSSTLRYFTIQTRTVSSINRTTGDARLLTGLAEDVDGDQHGPDEQQCKNCLQWIPKRTMVLHENFCYRNNVLCPHCKNVFQKSSDEWKSHWHCPHDTSYGNHPSSQLKHNEFLHPVNPIPCPSCEYMANTIPDLAHHRTSVCPGKLILCQFCHLTVPQEGDPFNPSADVLLSGLTAHELADGARTTNCHLCQAIVRLRDMATHLKHHELTRQSKPRPRICRNINCGRTLDGVSKNGEIGLGSRMGQGPGNDLGLCSICFGPLYVSMHDPEGKAMKRRIERRYIGQLISGCGKSWCANEMCKLGRQHTGVGTKGEVITTKEALPMIKPLMDRLSDSGTPMYFCVDEGSQKRRKLAELTAVEGVYDLEWCVAACEAENGNFDKAREWLGNWAPKIGEGSH